MNTGDNILGQVVAINNLLDYQQGAVVSRTIIKKTKSTVTIFAFDNGEGLSEHTASFDALVQIIEGEAEVIIEGKGRSIKEGELIIMPAHKPHAIKAKSRFKMLLIMIKN